MGYDFIRSFVFLFPYVFFFFSYIFVFLIFFFFCLAYISFMTGVYSSLVITNL